MTSRSNLSLWCFRKREQLPYLCNFIAPNEIVDALHQHGKRNIFDKRMHPTDKLRYGRVCVVDLMIRDANLQRSARQVVDSESTLAVVDAIRMSPLGLAALERATILLHIIGQNEKFQPPDPGKPL